jgi:RNA polymerase sigma-70 factor (ECF subfamily)
LFSIATRVAAQHRRAGGRERVVELLPTVGDVTASGGAELLTDTDRTAARLEAARILDGLLDTLPDDQRAVFILSEIEQLEAPEVAAALGVNVNTVYSRRRLAREKLERRLRRRLGASAGTGPLAWIA